MSEPRTDESTPQEAKPRVDPARGELPPSPEPLTGPILDSHTHLDLQDGSVAEVLKAAAAVGVRRVIQVGVDVASSKWGAAVAAEHAGLDATVALHPNEAPLVGDLDAELAQIDELAALDQVVGVGETGLDYFRTGEEGLLVQQASFRGHIEIAKRHNKALVIHDRDAHEDVLRVLTEEGPPEKVVFHCFSGDAEFARTCARRGYLMSFAGNVTFKNAQDLQHTARKLPADRMLVETDSPFLAPVPHRGRTCEPAFVADTARFVADLRGVNVETLAQETTDNFFKLFDKASA